MSDPVRRRSKFTSVNVQEVHSNIEQEVIEITTDKLKLILTEHISTLEKNKEWQAPLGVLITILVVFCTSKFQDFLTVEAAIWNAIFLVVGFASFAWLLRSLFQISVAMSIDDLINKIKNKS